MRKTTTALFLAAAALVVAFLTGCGESSTVNWKTLERVTDATSLQRAIELDDDKMSLVNAGLQHYRRLLQTRTTENQDRAKLLYNRIQMHANNSVILAGDFNRLAELELLHLGWAKGLTPPYTQDIENRTRAFDASAGILRTTDLMRPVPASTQQRRVFYNETYADALSRMNELCLVAMNPWSHHPEKSALPRLVERVRSMANEFLNNAENTVVDSNAGRYSQQTPFAETKYRKAFEKVCTGESTDAIAAEKAPQ